MDFNQVVTIADTVFTQETNGELVLLDMSTECYFGLDDVASDIWKLLETGITLQETLDSLLEMYDVEENQLQGDLEVLLGRLTQARLIELS